MSAVARVLVVGAGSAGCVVATLLARAGVEVDVVEIHDDVTALGSGITVQGNALRVLREIGAWDVAKHDGFGFESTGIRLPDGTLLVELDDIKTGGPDLPATMGMERRKLAKVLVDSAAAAGAGLRLGTTVSRLRRRRRGRRRHVLRRQRRPLRPGDRCGRGPIQRAVDDRDRHRARADRHGDLPCLHRPPRVDHADRPLLRRTVLHRRLLPDGRRLDVRLPRRTRAGSLRHAARGPLGAHAPARRGLPRTVGRHPRAHDRPEHRPLRLVREDAASRVRGGGGGSP